MRIVAAIVSSVVALLAILGIIVAGLWATDTPVDATVTGKDCSLGLGATSEVYVRTEFPVPGIPHTIKEVSNTVCAGLSKDNYVRYHLQTQRTIIYEDEAGPCLYDSQPTRGCGA